MNIARQKALEAICTAAVGDMQNIYTRPPTREIARAIASEASAGTAPMRAPPSAG